MTVECFTNDNGPLIVALVFNLGSNIEFESQHGYTHILEHYFLNLSRKQASDLLVQAYTESDHMEIRYISKYNTLERLKEIIRLVNSILIFQNHDRVAFERSKGDVLHEINNNRMRTGEKILQAVSGNTYHLPLGDFNTVKNITYNQFIDFSELFLAFSDLLLWVYGNVKSETLQSYVEETIKFKAQQCQIGLYNQNWPQWHAYQDSLSMRASVYHIILHDLLDVTRVYNKAIQMLGDEIIERIAAEYGLINHFTISHKYISSELKLVVITFKQLVEQHKVMSLQVLRDFLYQHLTDDAITEAKYEIIEWLNNSGKAGFKAIQLLEDRRRHFLYKEYSIYDRESLEMLINQMYQIGYWDIASYIHNLTKAPNILFVH